MIVVSTKVASVFTAAAGIFGTFVKMPETNGIGISGELFMVRFD